MAVPGRDNGLQAQAYTPLADLDRRLADAILALLRDSGIAAYVVPVGSDYDVRGDQYDNRAVQRPTDRLHVDAEAAEPAWQVLRTHLPSMNVEREGSGADSPPASTTRPRDEDEIWREIVAGYDSGPPGSVPPWPPSEDLPDDETQRRAADEDDEDTAPQAEGPNREPVPDPEEDHFVPPPPPPVPRPDPATGASWLCLFGGPAYLLISTMIGWHIPGWAAFLAVAAFIGGFVALVLRMGDEPPQDSGPDDGAVV